VDGDGSFARLRFGLLGGSDCGTDNLCFTFRIFDRGSAIPFCECDTFRKG
jgi:hypothetical protein